MVAVYQVRELTKVYKKGKKSESKANDAISFDIQEGEIFGLLGPNGAGKSTLVHQLAGLVSPTSGTIKLFGMDVVKYPRIIADYVAFQPQLLEALAGLYPEEALVITARLRGLSAVHARKECNMLMEEFGLKASGKKMIRHLSGGQRQLLNLAITFVGDRPIMIFDEPTNNLDPEMRRLIWNKMLELHQEGKTIIIVTHNVLEAESVIQSVGIVNHGRLLSLGSPETLKAQIDQSVRLEFILKAEVKDWKKLLEAFPGIRLLPSKHWILLCPREQLLARIDQLLRMLGVDQLEDFRIMTPSLEDVYLALGGGSKLT